MFSFLTFKSEFAEESLSFCATSLIRWSCWLSRITLSCWIVSEMRHIIPTLSFARQLCKKIPSSRPLRRSRSTFIWSAWDSGIGFSETLRHSYVCPTVCSRATSTRLWCTITSTACTRRYSSVFSTSTIGSSKFSRGMLEHKFDMDIYIFDFQLTLILMDYLVISVVPYSSGYLLFYNSIINLLIIIIK